MNDLEILLVIVIVLAWVKIFMQPWANKAQEEAREENQDTKETTPPGDNN